MPSVPFVIFLSPLYQWTSSAKGHPAKKHSKSSGFLPSMITFGVNEDQTTLGAARVENSFTKVTEWVKELFENERSRYISRVICTIKANFHLIVTMVMIAALQKRVE